MCEARKEIDDTLDKMKFKSYLLKQVTVNLKKTKRGKDWRQEEGLKASYEDALAWHFVFCFGLKRGKIHYMTGIWLNGTLDSKGWIKKKKVYVLIWPKIMKEFCRINLTENQENAFQSHLLHLCLSQDLRSKDKRICSRFTHALLPSLYCRFKCVAQENKRRLHFLSVQGWAGGAGSPCTGPTNTKQQAQGCSPARWRPRMPSDKLEYLQGEKTQSRHHISSHRRLTVT